jgi:ABC-type lipoprotein export system ATPase subunit
MSGFFSSLLFFLLLSTSPFRISCCSMILNFKNVNKSYFRHKIQIHVLHDINLQLDSGEFCALMGASGSGKSTLLQICGAMLNADSGDCQLLHYQLHSAHEDILTSIRRRHIGFVFQNTHLLPTLTIRENIELPLRLLNSPAKTIKLKAEQLAERVGIKDRLDHFPDEVSGGEAQRATIARAIIHAPDILIADEPPQVV